VVPREFAFKTHEEPKPMIMDEQTKHLIELIKLVINYSAILWIIGKLLQSFNLVIAAFASMMMFRMETETSTAERPWTKYLGIAFGLFAAQYLFFLFDGNNLGKLSFFWGELFGIPINIYLLLAARILLNKGKQLPRWFLLLVLFDLIAIVLRSGPYRDSPTAGNVPTICQLLADGMSTITLMCLAYASYISSKFYRPPARAIILGLVISVYAFIHLVSPLVPKIATWTGKKTLETEVILVLSFIAAVSKLALLYFAFLVTTLENRTLINFRNYLRESLSERKVFFSGAVMLRAISEAFNDRSVKLYIRVPPMKPDVSERMVDVFSWSQSREGFNTVRESETPLPELEQKLISEKPAPQATATRGFQFKNLFQLTRPTQTPQPFDGLKPMRYHGALIGCLRIEKKSDLEFTYSAEGLCKVFSEDIAPMAQFYRLQISLRVFDELSQKQEIRSQQTDGLVSLEELRKKFEEIIHEVLSPQKTHFLINTGFVHTPGEQNNGAENTDPEMQTEDCTPEGFSRARTKPIGQIRLQYQPERDPIAKPSLGAFDAYRVTVASVVTRLFLATVEKKLHHVIEKLSLELAKKQDFQSLNQHVRQSARDAELASAVLYHPDYREFRKLQPPHDWDDEASVGRDLTETGLASWPTLNDGESYQAQIVSQTPTLLILGIKLPTSGASLFVGVKRVEFAGELHLDTPWRNFLTKLADVTDKAFERIVQAKELQKKQVELAEGYMVQSTAELIGLYTHELINRVENLNGSNALLRGALEETDSKELIREQVEDLRKEFNDLRTLVGGIRNAAPISHQTGPCSLRKALNEVISLHQTRTNIEIELGDFTLHTPEASQKLSDVQIALPENIVKLTFENLISNSLAAIRQLNANHNGAEKPVTGKLNHRHLVRIWVNVTEGQRLIDCFVNDTGCGIPSGLIDSIFDANVSTKPGHSGLGLFLVKRRLMRDGSINVDHSEPGNTTFHVRLPRVPE